MWKLYICSFASPSALLHLSFNQYHACFAVGTNRGFRTLNCNLFREIFRRDFDCRVAAVEMLFRCNILALVGGGPDPQYPHYKQIIGSLLYLTTTRPDLQFSVSLLNRFMSSPTKLHAQVAKRVLRYLMGTIDFGIWYKRGGAGELLVYTDSYFAGDVDTRNSTSWHVFLMDNAAVAWLSKKQPIVTYPPPKLSVWLLLRFIWNSSLATYSLCFFSFKCCCLAVSVASGFIPSHYDLYAALWAFLYITDYLLCLFNYLQSNYLFLVLFGL